MPPDPLIPREQTGDVGDPQEGFPGGTRKAAEAVAHVHGAGVPAEDEAAVKFVLRGKKRFPQGRRAAFTRTRQGGRGAAPHREDRGGGLLH